MTKDTPEDVPVLAPVPGLTPQDQTAKTAGRGFLIITVAKVWFLITAAVTQLGLPIFFGDAEKFGVFKVVTESIGLVNMVVITGTMQAVAKLVSEEPGRARKLVHQALRMQCVFGLGLGLAYGVASPWVAQHIFHDGSLGPLMQLSSLIVVFYAFYAVFVGYLNGTKAFVRQAQFDIGFQSMKTVGILGLVWLGFGVWGAVSGFVGAAGLICVIAAVWTLRLLSGQPEVPGGSEVGEGDRDRRRRLGVFLVWVMAYTFALNGLLRLDLFMIKSFASATPPHLSAAQVGEVFGQVSDKFAGLYGAALNLSRLPYQGVIAVTFVIFPLISEATFAQDRQRTRDYIEQTFRYCALLICVVALPLIFNADSLMGALYSAEYAAASAALEMMSVGIVCFSLFYVAVTMITGAGRPGVAAALMGASLGASALLNWVFLSAVHQEAVASLSYVAPQTVPGQWVHNAVAMGRAKAELAGDFLGSGPAYMWAGAGATASAMAFGMVASFAWIWRTYRAAIPGGTVARLGLGALVLWGVDVLVGDPAGLLGMENAGKIVTLGLVGAKMGLMALVLLGVLGLSREFGAADRARFMAVLGRRGKKRA